MTNFSDVNDFLNSFENEEENHRLKRFNQDEINQLRQKYIGIPNDFLDYLAQVGAGSLNRCRYMIYGDLLKPSDIFNLEDVEEFENQNLLFGDDFAGNPAGFLVSEHWRVAEILHEDLTVSEIDLTFSQFIRQIIGMEDDHHKNKELF